MSNKRWRKVLYQNQGFPDNYTDKETFLSDLKTNTNVQEIHIPEAILGSTLLLQELCTVVAFILVYIYLLNEWVEPELVFTESCILTALGFIWYRLMYTEELLNILGHDLRTVLIFLVFGQLFSPILHTLTDTISTDSIYTMTFLMMVVHLIFFDYGVKAALVSRSLSLNAAMFASVCLASRLSSAYHAFILLTVAVECFVLFPFLRNKLKNSLIITVILFILDFYFLYLISKQFIVIFTLAALFINIVCPVLFVKYQKHKENIYGPWDEAIVDDIDNAAYLQF